MFDSKLLFGLKPEIEYIAGRCLSGAEDYPKLLTPGFIESFHEIQEEANGIIYITTGNSPKNTGPGINAIFPFCQQGRRSNRSVVARWLPTENFINRHRFETAEMFNISHLQDTLLEVLKTGAITFSTDDIEEASLILMEIRGSISKQFSFYSHFKRSLGTYPVSTTDPDNLVLMTTFVPLEYCIPIYNRRYVEGMGILLSAVYPRTTKSINTLAVAEEILVIVSNHSSNLLQVDGTKIRDCALPDSSRMNHFVSTFSKEGERRRLRGKAPKGQTKKKLVEKKTKEVKIETPESAGSAGGGFTDVSSSYARYYGTSTTNF